MIGRLILSAALLPLAACQTAPHGPAVLVPTEYVQAEAESLRAVLEHVLIGGTPALIAPDTSTWAESLTGIVLLGALETANGLDDESFDDMATHGAARLLLQNDVWGLWQRTSSEGSVSSIREELHLAAEGLMRRLAAPANVAPNRTAIPAAIAPHLVGFEPEESEMPILQHELAYDARRVFHIAIRGEQREERALYSTLIGVGPDGHLYETDVVAELEMLRFDGDDLVHARVFEIHPEALGSTQGSGSLVEVEAVERVPSRGANHTVAQFDGPIALADLPCANCHHDASMMSLPSPNLALGARNGGVLSFAARHAPDTQER